MPSSSCSLLSGVGLLLVPLLVFGAPSFDERTIGATEHVNRADRVPFKCDWNSTTAHLNSSATETTATSAPSQLPTDAPASPEAVVKVVNDATKASAQYVKKIVSFAQGTPSNAALLAKPLDQLIEITTELSGKLQALGLHSYDPDERLSETETSIVALLEGWVLTYQALEVLAASTHLEDQVEDRPGDWLIGTLTVAKSLKQSVPKGDLHPLYLRAVSAAGVHPKSVEDIWDGKRSKFNRRSIDLTLRDASSNRTALPLGPLNLYILNATHFSAPYVDKILSICAQNSSSIGDAVDQELEAIVGVIDYLVEQIKILDMRKYRIGIVVQPIIKYFLKLLTSWIRTSVAIQNSSYGKSSGGYGLEDWTASTQQVVRMLQGALPDREEPLFEQACRKLGLDPSGVQDLWDVTDFSDHA